MKSALTHPLMAAVLLILLCRIGIPEAFQEPTPDGKSTKWSVHWNREFYPLNSFPMYADPAQGESSYVIVADGNGAPIAIEKITGTSSAKVKKRYTDQLNKLMRGTGIKPQLAPPETRQKAWDFVAEGLRKEAAHRRRTLPPVLQYQLGTIRQKASGFEEKVELICTSTP